MSSFRPRQVDIDKPLPILHHELDDEELDGAVTLKLAPTFGSGMEKEEEAERHLQQALYNPTAITEGPAIPTPHVQEVPLYDAENTDYNRPPGYIKWDPDTQHGLDYDMDDEDERFLQELNATGKIFSQNKFEKLVDQIEKDLIVSNKFNVLKEQTLPVEHFKPHVNEAKWGAFEKVYEYWLNKRKRLKVRTSMNPYLFHELKPTPQEDTSPLHAFRSRPENTKNERSRRHRKNDAVTLARLRQLRQEMDKARDLLEMVRRREKMKQERLELMSQLFDYRVDQIQNFITNPSLMKDEWLADIEDYATESVLHLELPPINPQQQIQNVANQNSSNDSFQFAMPAPRKTGPLKRPGAPGRPGRKAGIHTENERREKVIESFMTKFEWSEDVELVPSSSDEEDDRFREESTSDIDMQITSPSSSQQKLPEPPKLDPPRDVAPPIPTFMKDLGFPAMPKPSEKLVFPIISEQVLPDIVPFRGRARLGRGGRVLFDRKPQVRQRDPDSETFEPIEHEYSEILQPRLSSIIDIYQSGKHPSLVPDPKDLMPYIEAILKKGAKPEQPPKIEMPTPKIVMSTPKPPPSHSSSTTTTTSTSTSSSNNNNNTNNFNNSMNNVNNNKEQNGSSTTTTTTTTNTTPIREKITITGRAPSPNVNQISPTQQQQNTQQQQQQQQSSIQSPGASPTLPRSSSAPKIRIPGFALTQITKQTNPNVATNTNNNNNNNTTDFSSPSGGGGNFSNQWS